MTNELVKVVSQPFGDVVCDFFENEQNEIFMSSEQLGNALEYKEARKAIGKLVERNPELEEEEFSSIVKLTTEAGIREMRIFTEDGIYEIVSLSKQPKASDFRKWVRGVIKSIRKTGSYDAETERDSDKRNFFTDAIILYFVEEDGANGVFATAFREAMMKFYNENNEFREVANKIMIETLEDAGAVIVENDTQKYPKPQLVH